MVKEIADKKNLISENTNREMDHDKCAKFTQKTSLPLAGLLPKWYAVVMWDSIPSSLHHSWNNSAANCVPRSEMICSGSPWMGYTLSKSSCARSLAEKLFVIARKRLLFNNRHTITQIAL